MNALEHLTWQMLRTAALLGAFMVLNSSALWLLSACLLTAIWAHRVPSAHFTAKTTEYLSLSDELVRSRTCFCTQAL